MPERYREDADVLLRIARGSLERRFGLASALAAMAAAALLLMHETVDRHLTLVQGDTNE